MTTLQLDSCSFMNSHLLHCISTHCKQLTCLSLKSCCNIENVRDEVRDGFLQLKELKRLKSLDLYRTLCDQTAILEIISSCKQIEHLNLGACVKIREFDQVVAAIAEHLVCIKSLDLWRAYSLTNSGLYSISNCFMLEELDIGWW